MRTGARSEDFHLGFLNALVKEWEKMKFNRRDAETQSWRGVCPFLLMFAWKNVGSLNARF